MKKLLLAIPLVAGASWAGATYYSGAQTQTAYDQLLTQLNEMKPFTLVNESYNTGFTHSTAVTKVMDSAAADASVLFRLHHEIDHAPIGRNEEGIRMGGAYIKTSVVREDIPEELTEFMGSFVDEEPVQLITNVGYDGSSSNRFLISAFKHDYDDVNVRWDGVDYTIDVNGDSVVGSGTIGEAVMHSEGKIMRLSAGNIKTDLTRISQAVYSGSYGVEFDDYSHSDDEMPFKVVLQSISITSDSKVDGDTLDSRFTVSVGNIDTPLPLKSASIDVGVSALSIAGMKQYVDTISQMSAGDVILASNANIMSELMLAYRPMIGPGTGLDYVFKVSNDDGDASLSYGISVIDAADPAYPAGGLDSITTVRDLLNVVELEAHMNADAAIVDNSPLAMYMSSPEAQRFIVADGVSYAADLSIKDLIVDINGNPLSLDLMMSEMLDMPLAHAMEAMDNR